LAWVDSCRRKYRIKHSTEVAATEAGDKQREFKCGASIGDAILMGGSFLGLACAMSRW